VKNKDIRTLLTPSLPLCATVLTLSFGDIIGKFLDGIYVSEKTTVVAKEQ
jgi:hypothetical protein